MSVRSLKPSTGRHACASNGLSFKAVELLETEYRTDSRKRLELLGTPFLDQPGPLHETDTGGDFTGPSPQQRPGFVGGQFHHPDPLLLATAAEADFACGPDVSDPVGARKPAHHIPFAVHRHRANGCGPGNAGLAAGHGQHHRASPAEAQPEPRHLDEDFVRRLEPPWRFEGRLPAVSMCHACNSSQAVCTSRKGSMPWSCGPSPGVVTASSRSSASALSATFAAPMFSSRCATDRVPGISSVFGACASSHASPTRAGVTPISPAMSATTALSVTLGKPGNDDPSGKKGTQAIPSPPSPLQKSSISSCERSSRL